ncbi:amino acid ABC transporter ATP-binding protein [Burkholderia cenocepacia]|uniref:ATP-binding protein n=1 Tax=Burkholderia cenocepacia TaxID=95486 RepID=A0AAD0NEM9_9BURK|nr:amino acid ABC transporter ATP-binding protein [Burkholderia cenocepacia]AWG31856.1 ATP-binding protein [Burkholderia cenocepacia]MBR8200070.1 amino acid ABC transporter ATP-binding protein [Burkholderia cenocepacia]MBR8296219.1 amino acid ABC transporter ATP-binding protein [Burkholderia cenocepacia]HDV6328540.1 amino acid ABC transporter ATP-binding protein [Burkholderia cenocepacia]HDV6354543.1 amino acid ABC transporter ATP-binding protein [Burkholderia cenocepacia]
MIRLERIDKSFGTHRVLSGIDLALQPGSVTALIGPSGSGKSTLLRCVNLLEVPEAGALVVGDARIDFVSARRPSRDAVFAVRKQTGMVFQNFQLFPHLSVVQNVMEGLVTVQRWPRERARERALALLDKVGIADKADAWPATLSGGQQQRVAIARALAPSPQVLLCDEPTSALDPELSVEVVEVLRQLAREGTTMLMATHDLRLAASIAHDAVFLADGRIVEAGASRDLFGRPRDPRTAKFVATLAQGVPAF